MAVLGRLLVALPGNSLHDAGNPLRVVQERLHPHPEERGGHLEVDELLRSASFRQRVDDLECVADLFVRDALGHQSREQIEIANRAPNSSPPAGDERLVRPESGVAAPVSLI